MKVGVIVSGLPASGKTTVARALAAQLGLTCYDKDDVLEALFDAQGSKSRIDRQSLSRQSDADFEAAARAGGSAVLVSHWRAPDAGGTSGTPTSWLADTYDRLVEVWCDCPATEAQRRFAARTRHPGHGDAASDARGIARRFATWAGWYPMKLGPVIRVSTEQPADIPALARQVRAALGVDAA